jgi:hypothetical protein
MSKVVFHIEPTYVYGFKLKQTWKSYLTFIGYWEQWNFENSFFQVLDNPRAFEPKIVFSKRKKKRIWCPCPRFDEFLLRSFWYFIKVNVKEDLIRGRSLFAVSGKCGNFFQTKCTLISESKLSFKPVPVFKAKNQNCKLYVFFRLSFDNHKSTVIWKYFILLYIMYSGWSAARK